MKGFSYLYTFFFVGFISLIVVSYFTSVSISYLSQKGGLNNEYYNSISREFLSMMLNQIIKKINYYPSKINSVEELGILDGSVYLLKIKEVDSQVTIKIIEEKIKEEDDCNIVELILRLKVDTNFMKLNNHYYADLKISVISGKLPYYFFQPYGKVIENLYFYPFHNMKFYYTGDNPEIVLNIKNILKKIFKKDNKMDYSILRESLKLNKNINMPVVDGLYIGEIEGQYYIYLKGVMDKVILGKDENYQFIYAEQGENSLFFEYDNKNNNIIVNRNNVFQKIHGKFNGTILAEGDIKDVSSGKLVGYEIIKDNGAPAICDNKTINFIVAGSIKIDSSLKYEGISVEKGRFRREKTKLNLVQSNEKFFEDEKIDVKATLYGKELHGNYYFTEQLFIDKMLNIFGNIYSKNKIYNSMKIIEDPLNYSVKPGGFIPITKDNFTIVKSIKLLEIGEGK